MKRFLNAAMKTMVQSIIAYFFIALPFLSMDAAIISSDTPPPPPADVTAIYTSDFEDWISEKADRWHIGNTMFDEGLMSLKTSSTQRTAFLTSPQSFPFTANATYCIAIYFRAWEAQEEEISIYLSPESPTTASTPAESLIEFSSDYHIKKGWLDFEKNAYYLLTYETPDSFTAGNYFIAIKGHGGSSSYYTGLVISDFVLYGTGGETPAAEKTEHGYRLRGEDVGAWSEALNDAAAVHYDAREVTTPAEITVANRNALIELAEGCAVTSNGNVAHACDASEALTASSLSIDGAAPFFFGKDIATEAVTFTRSATSSASGEPVNFVTMVLPFEVTLAGAGVYMLRELSEDEQSLLFATHSESLIPAYTPFLYRTGGEDATLLGRNVAKAADEDADGLIMAECPQSEWQCAFATRELEIEDVTTDARFAGYDVYYISGDKFYRATRSLTLKPFRAIFLRANRGGTAPARLGIAIAPDAPTGVEGLDADADAQRAYTPAGVRASDGYRGIVVTARGTKTVSGGYAD